MPSTSAPQLPTGTVTFLFTDIEGSTRLLTALGDAYADVLRRHGDVLRAAIEANGGSEVSTEGDSFFAAFPSAVGAVRAAVDVQRALADERWPGDTPVRVRMGLHTGEGRLGGDNYLGMDVHRAARIAAAGSGGQVLLSDATQGLVRAEMPEGVDLRDLGEHRLKDLPSPERVWQLEIDGLERDFPALQAPDARPNNLPLSATSLIGRGRELEEIERLVGERRLVTLTGPGGTGKTRLALAVAHRLLPRCQDGVFFVALEEAVDRPAVAATIASALGVREQPNRDTEASLADFLRERELFLVLDNFEQALSAAPLVGELLAGSPRLRVAVTSRAALHLAGEQEFPVPPLSLPDPQHLPDVEALSQYEAVALFIQRARAVRPDFTVNNENAPAVAEICSRLDGLPLAIELAAAGVKLLGPQAILERLERHLPLPGAGPGDVPERQRTLRAAIDWSYDLLGEPERRLFERLAAFAGGWTLDAAEEVCNPDGELGIDTLNGLAALADTSLIRAASEDDAEPRFTMLQVIRDFAAEKLAAGPDEELVAARLAQHLLALAEEAEPQLILSDVRRWQQRLRREQENLRAVLRWAIDGGHGDIGHRLAGALWRYWHYWSELREGRRWLEAVLALPDRTPEAARGKALIGLAGVVYWQGETDAADRMYDEALAIFRELGDEPLIAEILFAKTYTAIARGSPEDAVSLAGEAIEHYRAAGDEPSAQLGELQMRAGQFFAGAGGTLEDALAATREAIEILGSSGRLHDEADWHGTLAQLHMAAGDYRRALEAHREATRAFYRIGNMGMLPWLKVAAAIELALGRPLRAVRLAAVAARAIDELGGELPAALMGVEDPMGDARSQLPEDEFAQAVEEGRAMSPDEAVAYLLEEPGE